MRISQKSLLLVLMTVFCLTMNPLKAEETKEKPTYRHIIFKYDQNPGLDIRITQIPNSNKVRFEERAPHNPGNWTDLVLAMSTVEREKLDSALLKIKKRAQISRALNIGTTTCATILGGIGGVITPVVGSAVASRLGLDTISSLLVIEALSFPLLNASAGAIYGVTSNQILFRDLFHYLNPTEYKSAMTAIDKLAAGALHLPHVIETEDYRIETFVVKMEEINPRPLEFRFALKHLLKVAYDLHSK